MNLKYVFFGFLFCLHYHSIKCNTERMTFFSTERPAVYWYDTNIFKNITVTSRRLNRQDPRHYMRLYIHPLITVTNDFKLDFYFYQFLTNRYRRSFVEMHFSFCDMLKSDTISGQAIRNAASGLDCPIPPGAYDLKNMSIPFVPKNFPFVKGRIYLNASISEGDVSKHVARASIDMEIKTAIIKKI